ncbi:RnfABCDGE type electron transport complex subunit D [Humisphaera borealis]|uniref:RnfABCDGE type electron transport complex subunit D n=1 Tax=Humisphaera borealis TaxID=2807512 RepID=A0A7M2WSZ7_9BACT|nr:RnfABCDGE type electron transport complex subunit D [Humisphaera borealis]QOV88302.1 RnfABCDGE type electron transport complex subunit D [Humisphaera borealis]
MDASVSSPNPTEAPTERPLDFAQSARVVCRVRSRPGPVLHSGVNVPAFYLVHALGASVPLVAGLTLFGFRALACVSIVIGSAFVAALVWRRIGRRGGQLQIPQVLWLALLLGLMLPAHLASEVPTPSATHVFTTAPWPLPAAAGVAVVMILWLAGGSGGRFHPAVYTILLIGSLFSVLLNPHWVLARKHILSGDVLNAAAPGAISIASEPWLRRPTDGGRDAFWIVPAAQWLSLYTRGQIPVDRGRMPMHELLRDRMPPLEDLVVGGHPAPIGCASLIGVIVGGLFLMYRGVIDFRVPLGVVVSMYAALLILPVPTVITETGPYYRWFIPREPDVGWAAAVTFVNYQMTAGPAVFMAFFLATAPSVRPLVRRARTLYAVLIGVASAAAQLYLTVSLGPYIALVAVALLAPIIDRWFAPRTLV